MGPEKLRKDIKGCTASLLALARDCCWNKFSDEVAYIISEIEDEGEGGWQKIIESRRNKDKLKPMDFAAMMKYVEEIYPEIHDINLFVHKAEKYRTIVDVRYFLKSKAVCETKLETPSMLHAKIAIPPYRGNDSHKFDVHWEFGGLRHQWKMFLWRKEMKRKRKKS